VAHFIFLSMHASQYTNFIKQKAKDYGFLSCGISKAEFLEAEAPRLEQWLNDQRHGQMQYMENYFDKRLDPRLLVEGSKSVISLAYNYFPRKILDQSDSYKISKYAYGFDYHEVIKEKLSLMLAELTQEIGEFGFRVFVDSAPVLERAWAKKSGLGWVGKNANIISKQKGSFFFLAEIICDLSLDYDLPTTEHCGRCTRCIDACPTQAILPNAVIDGSKCISYLTIELKEAIPQQFKAKMEDWMFGCDICQDVCPWNRFSTPHQEPKFEPHAQLGELKKQDWQELTEEVYRQVFKKSPVKRAKFLGLTRNISFLGDE
jgi:epoxyqueuosine reductase